MAKLHIERINKRKYANINMSKHLYTHIQNGFHPGRYSKNNIHL